MAGWNDLPLELKEVIFSAFVFRHYYPTLVLVSREFSVLAGKHLYESFEYADDPLDHMSQYTEVVAPRRGHLVREFCAHHTDLTDVDALYTVERLFRAMPNIERIFLAEETAAVAWRMPAAQREKVRELHITALAPGDNTQPARYAPILHAFPNVESLELDDIRDICAPLLISLVKSLHKLKHLNLWDVEGLNHPLITTDWSAPLESCIFSPSTAGFPLPLFRDFTHQFAETLRKLTVYLTFNPTITNSNFQFNLPALDDLSLSYTHANADLCTAFPHSPLRYLCITVTGNSSNSEYSLRALQQHKGALRTLSFNRRTSHSSMITLTAGEKRMFVAECEQLGAACGKEGVDFENRRERLSITEGL